MFSSSTCNCPPVLCVHTGTLLHKLMPWWFEPPALNQLGSPLPYSEIEGKINRDAAIMLLLILAAAAFAALKLLRVI